MLWLTLAAGTQRRWKAAPDFRKQLVMVGDEHLLQRQHRQVQERGHELVLVTHDTYIQGAAVKAGYRTLWQPKQRRWTVETLLASSERWPKRGRLVVLLGDVWYTDALMDALQRCPRPLAFYGNTAEVWAISATRKRFLRSMCKQTVRVAAHGGCKGTLRNLYHSCTRLPYEGDAYEPELKMERLHLNDWQQPPHTLWVQWDDETTDFDEPSDLGKRHRLARL
jgi:hypothetical protein